MKDNTKKTTSLVPIGTTGLTRLSSTLSITNKLLKKRVHELYNKAFVLMKDENLDPKEDFLARQIEDSNYRRIIDKIKSR